MSFSFCGDVPPYVDFLDEKEAFDHAFFNDRDDGDVPFGPDSRRGLNFDIEGDARDVDPLPGKFDIDDGLDEVCVGHDMHVAVHDRMLVDFQVFFQKGNFRFGLRHGLLAGVVGP